MNFYKFIFIFLLALSTTHTFASTVYTSNFKMALEDTPASFASDQDNNDGIFNIASKTHVDSNGKIVKVIINTVPIALGAENDLQLIISSDQAGASIIMHQENDTVDYYLPHTIYTATNDLNNMFEDCASKKMINVFGNQESCDGIEKSFSVVFNDLLRPDFSSFNSVENFVAGLFSLKNLTLNQTINLATTTNGFQNMMLL